VVSALNALIELNASQIEALEKADHSKLFSLDKELELSFGRKERAFGALRQHKRDHGC
jgi:hypothetical protein